MSIARELNNLQAQISQLEEGTVVALQAGANIAITGSQQYPIISATGVASGVSSLTAGGAGLLVSPSTGDVIIKNTGVVSLTAGTGVSVSNTTGAITINNTGITSLTAGTGISVSGSTITNTGITSLTAGTGISVSGSTITNTGITSLTAGDGITVSGSTITNNGVRSITAGTNVSITGTATNPIVNLAPSPLPAGVAINVNGTDYAFTNPALLANCILYSSVPLQSSGITIDFPTYAQLVATYGANAVIPFTIGNLNQQSPPLQTIYLTCNNDTTPSSVYFTQSVSSGNWVADNKTPSSSVFVLQRGCFWKGTIILDSVRGYAIVCLTWLSFM